MITGLIDSLQNLLAGLGTNRDKAAHSTFGPVIVNPVEMDNAYRGSWLARRAHRHAPA